MTFYKNIKKKCFGQWIQCPSKVTETKCSSTRDCIYHRECFKEWRASVNKDDKVIK